VVGASVRDVPTGQDFDVRARVTMNAAGAWAAALSANATGLSVPAMLPSVSRALNVVTPRASTGPAVGGLSDGRFFFKVPWRGVTMYGTSHDAFADAPDEARPAADAVEALLTDINRAFPGAPVSADEVSLVHWGLLPSVPASGPHVELAKQSLLRDHRADGVDGLVTVIGVRYTTARQTGQDAVDLASQQLQTTIAPSQGQYTKLVGGDFEEPSDLRRQVKAAVASASDADAERLARNYGSRVAEVLRLVADRPELAHPLSEVSPVWRAEVRLAAEAELALTLTDAVVRRTEAGSAGHPGPEGAVAAATEMADVLGWAPERVARELDALDDYYRLRPSPRG
jgi:glycerol-3-phosphate dehydrogenase